MAISDKRWKAGLMVVVIFVLGFIAGAMVPDLMSRPPDGPPPRGPHGGPDQFMKQLTQELSLTPEQGRAIGQVLAETKGEFDRLQHEFRPRFKEIRGRSRDRIRAALNPDQKAKYEEFVRRHDEKMKKRYQPKN
jgi:hypothetical protein